MLHVRADCSSKSGLQKIGRSAHAVCLKIIVYKILKGFQILWVSVIVVDIVGMFPDTTGQQWYTRLSQRIRYITDVLQRQLTIGILHQPGPSGAEVVDRRIGELLFERINRAEGAL